MSSDSCDTSAELSDEQVDRALKAVSKGMKASLAATFLSRGSKNLTSLITRIISAAFHHPGESTLTEAGLSIVGEMRSKTEFDAALRASIDNIQQTLMTSPKWEKIPVILATVYQRWSNVEGVLKLIFEILVKWVGDDVKKDEEKVNVFNCETLENFCDDKELKFRQVDCAESLLTVIGQDLFENSPDSFEALYNEIRSHLLKEDCGARDKLLRMMISLALVSDGMFEHKNIPKEQTDPEIQQELGRNSEEDPFTTAREIVDKYLTDWNAIQNEDCINDTIEHDETEDEGSGRLPSRMTARSNPLIEDICDTELDNVNHTRIELLKPSYFETVKSSKSTIAESEIIQKEKQEPRRLENTGTANRFNLKQNYVSTENMESSSDESSVEDFVETTHYVSKKCGRKENFRRDANNSMSDHGEPNQAAEVKSKFVEAMEVKDLKFVDAMEVKNQKFAEAMAEEEKIGGKVSSLESNEGENTIEDNVLDNKQTLRQCSFTSSRFLGRCATPPILTRNSESSGKNETDVGMNGQDSSCGRHSILDEPEAIENLQQKIPSKPVPNMIKQTPKVPMDMANLKLETDKQQFGNALKYQQTTSGGTHAYQRTTCEALGYLVQVVAEAPVRHELMYTDKYPVTDGAMYTGKYPVTDGAMYTGKYPVTDGAMYTDKYPVTDGAMYTGKYPVTDGAIIGRTSQCDVVVSSKTVSRTQAKIYREGEQVFFETLSKTNASLVNNIPVHCHSGPIRINNGYAIQVGEVPFVWEEIGKSLIEEGENREVSGVKDVNVCIQQSDKEAGKASASTGTALSDWQHIPTAEDLLLGVAGRGGASRSRRSVAARLEADVQRCRKLATADCQFVNGNFGDNPRDDTTAGKFGTKANRCDKRPNTIIDAATCHSEFSNEDQHDNHNKDLNDNHDESLNTSLPAAHNISFETKFFNVYEHKRKALKIPKRVPDVNTCRDGGRKSARIRSGRRQCVVNAVPQGPRGGRDCQSMMISRHYVEQDQVFCE